MELQHYIYLVLSLFLPILSHAQEESDWRYGSHFNAGFNLFFYTGNGQKFPGWKAYAGLSLSAINKHHFLVNYGPTLALYSKSLGASLSPFSDDIQFDFAHSFSLGGHWGDPTYPKYFRTLGNSAAYNTVLDARNAFLLSTVFVFNNHGRHQAVGGITGSFGDFTISYYNDGGTPIDLVPIADQFDRYWTGGIGFFFHNNSGFNHAEFLFDQFTGYEPMLYEMSTLLGIRVPDYNVHTGRAANFNTSAYNLRIMPYRNLGADIGVIGGLQAADGTPFGLQDIIHGLFHFSKHPNNDFNRFYLGTTYQHVAQDPF